MLAMDYLFLDTEVATALCITQNQSSSKSTLSWSNDSVKGFEIRDLVCPWLWFVCVSVHASIVVKYEPLVVKSHCPSVCPCPLSSDPKPSRAQTGLRSPQWEASCQLALVLSAIICQTLHTFEFGYPFGWRPIWIHQSNPTSSLLSATAAEEKVSGCRRLCLTASQRKE